MKIVNCPKGGRVPTGYCQKSCLNYPGARKKERGLLIRKLRNLFVSDGRTWVQVYKEDIAPRKQRAHCKTLDGSLRQS